MRFLRAIISDADVLKEFAEDIGADYRGGLFVKPEVEVSVEPWTITVDTYGKATGWFEDRHHTYYARLRSHYLSRDGFTFDIHLGTRKANDPLKLRELLDNPRLAELIRGRPSTRLRVRRPWRVFRPRLRRGVVELYLEELWSGKVDQLKPLLELQVQTLRQLREMGSAANESPLRGA